ncbi:MAG: site-2 protease family protein [Candidatus Sungbacteria bacterium]|nr:site-2 protease family protein [bacterium]MDZ4285892.1 site-2 protease family protein [Candidatus Sungbacteria bacterium]
MEIAMVIVIKIVVLIFSVVIHEVSHGYAALALGDRTAQYSGRLTLNPISHIDPFGSILLPLMTSLLGGPVFGWAKPVPYNPHNLRNQKWGPAIVGAAGPAANISIAVFFGLLIRFVPVLTKGGGGQFVENFITIAVAISILNLVLAVFNLIPIPPLDGSKVLFALLPYTWRNIQHVLERYGFFLLLIFIFFFAQLLVPVVDFLFRLITG